MPLLAPMLVVPTGRGGADAVAAGAAAAHEVPLPPPPHIVPPIHSSSTPGPSTDVHTTPRRLVLPPPQDHLVQLGKLLFKKILVRVVVILFLHHSPMKLYKLQRQQLLVVSRTLLN
nr:hypothetical protein [Tanacetum cinerariifolium]